MFAYSTSSYKLRCRTFFAGMLQFPSSHEYYSSLAHMNISYICFNMDVMSQLLGHDGGASISEKIITF